MSMSYKQIQKKAQVVEYIENIEHRKSMIQLDDIFIHVNVKKKIEEDGRKPHVKTIII